MEDHKIIALFGERSEDALKVLAEKYGRLCYTVANGILSSHEEAEECVNDTYLRAWENIPPDEPQKLSAYLAKITRNLALDRLESRKSLKRGGMLVLEELSDAIPSASQDTLSDEIGLKSALNSFLQALPELTRKVFLGRYFYCMSVKQLAREHAIGASHVKILLYRTRLSLKEYLEKEGIVI